MHGGAHERGMRSGTLATHQIVGMGEAARLATDSACHRRATQPGGACAERFLGRGFAIWAASAS